MSHSRLSTVALVVVFASIGVTVLQATLSCGPNQALYNSRCYQTYRPGPKCPSDFTFAAAEEYCQANNGELASIHEQAQNDFITALIKKDQHAQNQRNKCSKCPKSKKDYQYWIGLQLTHLPNGSVSGASWTDGSAVTYGDPTSESFRPPFVAGTPEGTVGDNSVPGEVCPLGNEKECVAVYGYGNTVGKWTDKNCSSVHTQQVSCSCAPSQGNTTAPAPQPHHKKWPSSSSEEEDQVDECRDEAALNGFICQYCPAGWTYFQGHCYIAVVGTGNAAQHTAACQALDANVVSIHSTEENQFVTALAAAASPGNTANFIGLSMTHTGLLFNDPVNSAAWTDGTPVNFGNPTAPGFVQGTYPWAPSQQFPAQPDNRPPPGNCVIQWLPAFAGEPASTWDDVDCPQVSTGSTVCKI